MAHEFETERLILRNFQDADLTPFHAYRNDPEVAKYQSWKVPYSLEKAREFVQLVKSVPLGLPGEHYQLAIVEKTAGNMIGDIAYWSGGNDQRVISVGYTVARAYWRRGFAREAVSRLLDFLFGDLGAHRVTADCDTNNLASFRLMESLGFRREAHLVESYWMGGYWGDEYYYGILAREWMERRSGEPSVDQFSTDEADQSMV